MLTGTALTPEALLVALPEARKRFCAIAYRGDRSRMESYLRNLSWRGLMEERRIEGHSPYSTRVLTLTKDGHRLAERNSSPIERALYHGLVKSKEARHDEQAHPSGKVMFSLH